MEAAFSSSLFQHAKREAGASEEQIRQLLESIARPLSEWEFDRFSDSSGAIRSRPRTRFTTPIFRRPASAYELIVACMGHRNSCSFQEAGELVGIRPAFHLIGCPMNLPVDQPR